MPADISRRPVLTIILVLYNNDQTEVQNLIDVFLDAARAALFQANAIAIANDGKAYDLDNCSVFRSIENIGFSAAVNQAFSHLSDSDYALVANPDCVADAVPLSEFFKRQEGERRISFPALLDHNGNLDFIAYENWTFSWGRQYSKYRCARLNRKGGEHLQRWAKAPGAFLLGPVDLFRRAGLFDERFFLYAEDRDFTDRCRKMSVILYFDRVLEIHHLRGESAKSAPQLVIRAQLDGAIGIAHRRYGALGALLARLDIYLQYQLRSKYNTNAMYRRAHASVGRRWRATWPKDPGRPNLIELLDNGHAE